MGTSFRIRLCRERSDNNLDQSWNLSLVGDWNNYTENASVQNRTHGPTHEILTVAGQALTHDAKGNPTLIPSSLRTQASSLAWDFENKLSDVDTDDDWTDDVSYTWDALLRRVASDDGTTHTVYVQNGQQTVAEYGYGVAPASETFNYVWGGYIDEPVVRTGAAGNRYYHCNQQYSIIGLTDASGTLKEQYAYDANGGLTVLDGSGTAVIGVGESNRYTYTCRKWDRTIGLYHFQARMYDPNAGRFCANNPMISGFGMIDHYVRHDFFPEIWMSIAMSRAAMDVHQSTAIAEAFLGKFSTPETWNPLKYIYAHSPRSPLQTLDPTGKRPFCFCCVPLAVVAGPNRGFPTATVQTCYILQCKSTVHSCLTLLCPTMPCSTEDGYTISGTGVPTLIARIDIGCAL